MPQMSAVKTGQMSDVFCGDRQMSSVLSQQKTSVLSQPQTSVLTQQQTSLLLQEHSHLSCLRSLNCGNVPMFKSQKVGPALDRRKWFEMGPEWSPGPENPPK